MFVLHESTQRSLIRAAFLLVGVLPAVCIGAWALERRTTAHTEAHVRQLRANFGWPLEVASLEHPRPGEVRYRGLLLRDPETAAPLLRCDALHVSRRAGGFHLIAEGVHLAETSPGWCWQQAKRLIKGEVALAENVKFSTDLLHVAQSDGPSIQLEKFHAGYEQSPHGPYAYAAFRRANQPDEVRLRIARDRRSQPPRTGVEVQTGNTALPVSLCTSLIGRADWLADDATLAGYLVAADYDGSWAVECSGTLEGLLLKRLIDARFPPHHLQGRGQLHVDRAWALDGRIQEARGRLSAEGGSVSRTLLDSCIASLGMFPPDRDDLVHDKIAFDRLSLGFTLQERGLQFSGTGVGPRPAAVLIDAGGPILNASHIPQPVAHLVKALVPTDLPQVPAAPQGAALLSRLPLSQKPLK